MRATQVKQAFRCRIDCDLSEFPTIIDVLTGWPAFAGHDNLWVTNKGRWYKTWLADAAAVHACAIHAYVLMTNHVHLLVTPGRGDSVPRMMQVLGRRYVRHFNDSYRRSGTLWEGRYRAAPVDSESYFLACSRYIELNPVRARMVARPLDYPWSSYRAHAHGKADPLLADHAIYKGLGRSAAERQISYRARFATPLEREFVDAVRAATNGGWALGSEGFKARIAAVLKRRVAPLPPGPPAKQAAGKTQMTLL
jgi:putative transposase